MSLKNVSLLRSRGKVWMPWPMLVLMVKKNLGELSETDLTNLTRQAINTGGIVRH